MVVRMALRADAREVLRSYYIRAFQLDLSLWQQYLNLWNALLRSDLEIST